jgi:hypothetical protein
MIRHFKPQLLLLLIFVPACPPADHRQRKMRSSVRIIQLPITCCHCCCVLLLLLLLLRYLSSHHIQRKMRSSDRTNAQVAKYAAAVRALGAEQAVPVLDMFSLVNSLPASERAAWSDDGVHPGAAGQAMVFQALKSALESMVQFDDLRCAWGGCCCCGGGGCQFDCINLL